MPSTCVALANQSTFLLHIRKITLNSSSNYRQNYRHLLCRNERIILYQFTYSLLSISQLNYRQTIDITGDITGDIFLATGDIKPTLEGHQCASTMRLHSWHWQPNFLESVINSMFWHSFGFVLLMSNQFETLQRYKFSISLGTVLKKAKLPDF